MSITRAHFEELCLHLFRGTLEKSLRDAKAVKGQVHEIVLFGDCTWIPKVQHFDYGCSTVVLIKL